mmetsp:Transcript_8351/g.19668  ORF Transcript_8351/g.19668 Transcript_8351/m.19668 type:complete len:209 (+) Transcript_8351:98-724(+)
MGASCCKVAESQASTDSEHTTDARVSSEAFLDMLEKRASVLHPEGRTSNKVLINLGLVETILLEDEREDPSTILTSEPDAPVARSARGRKGTGFVTKEQISAALEKSGPDGVSFSDEGIEVQEAKSESRTKSRKPTGFVTKEKLLHALANMSEDEDDEEGEKQEEKMEAPAAVTQPAPVRSGKRKGTGFVSKKQLQKVINIYGEDDDE